MTVESSLFDQFPFLQALPPEVLATVAAQSHTKRFPAHHLVMAHHSRLAFFVLVISGQLQLTEVSEDGRITGISVVNAGQALDWLSLIDNLPIVHSITTTKETDLLLVPILLAKELVSNHQSLASHALIQLSNDVRRLTEQRQILTLPNAFQRVFVQIIQIAEQNPEMATSNLPRQHEIAAMVNTSRETVSRAIQMLIKHGILVKNGHRFMIQGTDQLRRLAALGGQTDKVAKA